MSSRWTKALRLYHILLISALLVVITASIRYFGSIGSAGTSSLFELTIEVENLEKEPFIENIRKLVASDRTRESLAMLENVDTRASDINKAIKTEEYGLFREEGLKVKDSLLKLISFPELFSIFVVLNTKVGQFKDYVSENRWRTLTKISERLSTKVDSFKAKGFNTQKARQLENFYSGIARDIKAMKRITERSVLSRTDKNNILRRLSDWSKEMTMFKGYIDELKNFDQRYVDLKGSYDSWYQTILPMVIEQKLDLEKKLRNLFLFAILLVAFLLINLVLTFPVYRWIGEKISGSHEKSILDIIQQSVVPFDGKIASGYSQHFRTEVERIKKYFHKRMSYGAIFQEATPFSALLLDSNLSVIWANDLFYRTWNLDRNKHDGSFSWDYLQRYTNLGEDDPIELALRNAVAGIYNIQVKPQDSHEAFPYEMYVTPVQYLEQNRIMLFLYPLRSLQETLSDQTKSLTGPIVRMLDAFVSNNYTDDFSARVAKDFTIAGIGHIYEKFLEYRGSVEGEKSGLMGDIQGLENEVADACKALGDIKESKDAGECDSRALLHLFLDMKNVFVRSMDGRNKTIEHQGHINTRLLSLWTEQRNLLNHSFRMGAVLNEKRRAFAVVLKFRNEFREAKKKLGDFRQDIVYIIDRFMVERKRSGKYLDTGREFQEIKTEVKKVDDTLDALSDVSTQLDIALSKVELVVKEYKVPDLRQIDTVFKEIQKIIESEMAAISDLHSSVEDADREIVDGLQNIHGKFHNVYGNFREIGALADSYRSGHGNKMIPPPLPKEGTIFKESQA